MFPGQLSVSGKFSESRNIADRLGIDRRAGSRTGRNPGRLKTKASPWRKEEELFGPNEECQAGQLSSCLVPVGFWVTGDRENLERSNCVGFLTL